MILTPPVLPPFLAGTYGLKPVEGVPSDEEVKTVHAVIRVLDDVANVPLLYDADLATRLSMHLFGIQMECLARYRDKHPYITFPSNTMYTPPPLPVHIPVELEPVTGPPSDSQIKSVRTALRLYESMANIPAMFDADLDMKLSQHLFDIQFERYLRQVADGNPSASVTSLEGQNANESDPDDADPLDIKKGALERDQEEADRDVSITEPAATSSSQAATEMRSRGSVSRSSTVVQNTTEPLEPTQSEPKQSPADLLKDGQEDANKLLVEIRDGLEDVKQVLIGTQQNMARGLNRRNYTSDWRCAHTMLNANGEEPHALGLANVVHIQYNLVGGHHIHDPELAQCLQFYGLGAELIEGEGGPTIKEGSRDEARATLKLYFGL
ncbi:hypothetical protein FRC08_012424 [Ceratobasidium sp. 394]|nr:hypothetical protein FRC08_012424 [Ceratobasidium sp. 394]